MSEASAPARNDAAVGYALATACAKARYMGPMTASNIPTTNRNGMTGAYTVTSSSAAAGLLPGIDRCHDPSATGHRILRFPPPDDLASSVVPRPAPFRSPDPDRLA